MKLFDCNLPARLGRGLLDMVYPRVCEVCERPLTVAERYICLECELNMPLTDCHLSDFNTIHQRVATHPPIERAAALMHYMRGDDYVKLIHKGKYGNRPDLIYHLTRQFAERLLQSSDFFDGIDSVQPVPMHWLKELWRGYNQTDWMAQALSDTVGLERLNALRVAKFHATQTRKNRYERWLNAARNTYVAQTRPGQLSNRHVVLVDDVITTGSTIKVCAEVLAAANPGVRISLLSLGLTRLH